MTGRLRVIGGVWRGRRLRTMPGAQVRPTADRVRESLFNILGERVRGAALLDAYAGTGAVGIEALSRGARHVTFVESNRAALDLLSRNLSLVRNGAGDLVEQAGTVRVIPGDLREAVLTMRRDQLAYDIMFLDPPYMGGELDRALRLLSRSSLLGDRTILIVEHASGTKPPSSRTFSPARTVTYGRSALTFYAISADHSCEFDTR